MSRDRREDVPPLNAATLIIVRDGAEVLMGIRHSNHVFMPNKYVFPGGRLDEEDHRAHRPVPLHSSVRAKLEKRADAGLAAPLAMAAVRETFEETGLALGKPGSIDRSSLESAGESWAAFFGLGLVPALDQLRFLARAVTPPGGPRRFDSRFFMTDSRHMHGELRSNGELLDLRWVPIEESFGLDLPHITRHVLKLLQMRLATSTGPGELKPDLPVPLVHWVGDEVVVEDL